MGTEPIIESVQASTKADPVTTTPAATAAESTPPAKTEAIAAPNPAEAVTPSATVTSIISATPAETKSETPPVATEPKVTEGSTEPEKFEIKIPDGSIFDQTHVERIKADAKANGWDAKRAQEVLDRDHNIVQAYDAAQAEMVKQRNSQWLDEVKADPELGGVKFEETLTFVEAGMKKLGTDRLRRELTASGLANHPEIVRAFYRAGKMSQPDNMVLPGTQPPPPKTREEIFYGRKTK